MAPRSSCGCNSSAAHSDVWPLSVGLGLRDRWVTRGRASRDAAIADGLAPEHKATRDGRRPVGLGRADHGSFRTALLVLMAAVGLLLVMAATNVASLTLGFMRRRGHELVVRRAIGASTARVVRQLMTHSVVLGAIGCLVGLIAAVAGTQLLVAVLPPELPRSSAIRVNGTVLTITAAVVSAVDSAVRHRGPPAESIGHRYEPRDGASLRRAHVANWKWLAGVAEVAPGSCLRSSPA